MRIDSVNFIYINDMIGQLKGKNIRQALYVQILKGVLLNCPQDNSLKKN